MIKIATSFSWRKAERIGAVQPGQEKALEILYCSLPVPEGGLEER